MKSKKRNLELIGVWIAFVLILLFTYLSAEVTIQGVPLPRHEAGMWGVIMWFAMMALAAIGALALHGIVEGIVWITKWKLWKIKQ